jgi:hypothetical protein
MCEQSLSRRPHAFHAVLPVVSQQGKEAVEDSRQQTSMSVVQMGNRQGILEFLRLVQETTAAQVSIKWVIQTTR